MTCLQVSNYHRMLHKQRPSSITDSIFHFSEGTSHKNLNINNGLKRKKSSDQSITEDSTQSTMEIYSESQKYTRNVIDSLWYTYNWVRKQFPEVVNVLSQQCREGQVKSQILETIDSIRLISVQKQWIAPYVILQVNV